MNNIRDNIILEVGKHLVFWALSYWMLLRLLAYTDTIYFVDHLYTSLYHLSLVVVFYLNFYVAIPRLLQTQKYIWYGLSSILIVLFGCWLNDFTFRYLSDWLFPDYFFISHYGFIELLQMIGIYWLASTLLKLSRSWFQLQRTKQHLEQVEKEKIRAELGMLKAQVNPHFLFNSLHNIYALTLDQDPRSSELIVLLSQVLRYTLYEAKGELVSVVKEVENLQNYIALQSIRMPELTVNFDMQGISDESRIAPLLLLPLVENAFKHGNVNGDDFFIDIKLTVENQQLNMSVKNSINLLENKEPGDTTGGIGLENFKRRLKLLYPNQYTFEVKQTTTYFRVTLNLKIQN